MSIKTTLDAWTDICRKLFPAGRDTSVHPLHSCVINGEKYYVHAPDLANTDSVYFNKLVRFADKQGIKLKADRRKASDLTKHCRRKKLLPIVFLAFGVNSISAFSDESSSTVSLNLIENKSDAPWKESITSVPEKKALDIPVNNMLANRIESILLKHFVTGSNDPNAIKKDLRKLAEYYSIHTEALSLIESLDNKNWQLKYAPHTYQTDVIGTRLSVNSVTVYFDPSSGAKLKFYDKCAEKKPFCVASPADALLHELLHAQTILLDTNLFIAQGGLNEVMYPAVHERSTILKENILYKSMTRRDNKPRPIRSEHSGRHVLVSCVTCVD